MQYLLKWLGWPIESSTWEPLENLSHVKNLIEEYEAAQLEKKKCNEKEEVSEKKAKTKKENKHEYEENIKEKITQIKCDSDYKSKRKPENDSPVITDLMGNVPGEVIGVIQDKNKKILCLVKFKERADGTVIEDSYVPSIILREYYPKILIKFYESKIKFVDKPAEKDTG